MGASKIPVMSPRTVAGAVAALALMLAPAADAKHRKPLTGTFEVTNTVPWPVDGGMCDSADHNMDRHVEKVRLPAAGELRVWVKGFVGDMDVVLMNDKGEWLADGKNESSTSGATPSDGSIEETAKYKPKRAVTVQIHVCNFAASPNASGRWQFTFAK